MYQQRLRRQICAHRRLGPGFLRIAKLRRRDGPPLESSGGPITTSTQTMPIWFSCLALAFGSRSLVEQLIEMPGVRHAAFFLADHAANRN